MKVALEQVKGYVWALVLGAMAMAFAGCESAGASGGAGASPRVTQPGSTNMVAVPGRETLQIGDRLLISFSESPSPPTSQDARIRDDGTISLPFDITVTAVGKRPAELETEIKNIYVPKYFVRLTVSVKAADQFIYVGGYVKAPNRYVYAGDMTVLKAIKVAGDFNEYGDRKRVRLTRADGTQHMINCEKALKNSKLDLPVYPGDTIHIKMRNW
jgi:protein involved in polysaccharide export with SLBB domain